MNNPEVKVKIEATYMEDMVPSSHESNLLDYAILEAKEELKQEIKNQITKRLLESPEYVQHIDSQVQGILLEIEKENKD